MTRRTTYIKTRQEISINKNFSTSLNTMIENVENIEKYNKEEITDNKYSVHNGKRYEYITLTFNKNNGKYILEMLEKIDEQSNIDKIVYIKELAKQNKQDMQIINSKIDEFENVRARDKKLIKELIATFEENGNNTFFDNSKEICIAEMSNIINSEFNAKKIYTMLINKLNFIDKKIKAKEQYTSKYQISKIKNKDKSFNEEFEFGFGHIINNINSSYEMTEQKYQYIFKEEIEEIKKIDEDIKRINGSLLFENYIIDKNEQRQYNLKLHNSEDGLYTENELEQLDKILEAKWEEKQKSLELRSQKLKLKYSASKLLLLYDMLEEYSDIRIFGLEKRYKKTSTLIKKYYQNKIKNIKKYSRQYDNYIHNRANRAKKVREIEFFDKLIVSNLGVISNLLYIIEGTNSSEIIDNENGRTNADKIMDEITTVLKEQYSDDSYLLKKKLNKLESISKLMIYLINEYQEQYMYEELFWNIKELRKMEEYERALCEDNEEYEEVTEEENEKFSNVGSLFGE